MSAQRRRLDAVVRIVRDYLKIESMAGESFVIRIENEKGVVVSIPCPDGLEIPCEQEQQQQVDPPGIAANGAELIVSPAPTPPPPTPTPPPPTVAVTTAQQQLPLRRFSAEEVQILSATHPVDYRSGERIAQLTGLRHCEGLKRLLSNLADRGALEALSGRGYRHAPGLVVD